MFIVMFVCYALQTGLLRFIPGRKGNMEQQKLPNLGKLKCTVVRVGKWGDLWCTRHAAYVIDCVECGRIVHTSRPHTRYCSAACKQRAYRRRKSIERADV